MGDKQYDVSPEFKALFERKQKQRMEFRQYYLKHSTNPYRHASGEGGFVFDPNVHRFMALQEYAEEYFKPNYRSVRWLALGVVFPMIAVYSFIKWKKEEQYEEIRTGKIAYKDRMWKNVN